MHHAVQSVERGRGIVEGLRGVNPAVPALAQRVVSPSSEQSNRPPDAQAGRPIATFRLMARFCALALQKSEACRYTDLGAISRLTMNQPKTSFFPSSCAVRCAVAGRISGVRSTFKISQLRQIPRFAKILNCHRAGC